MSIKNAWQHWRTTLIGLFVAACAGIYPLLTNGHFTGKHLILAAAAGIIGAIVKDPKILGGG